MTVSRLRAIPGIGVDRMGDAADAAGDPEILRLENLDTDIPPPRAAIHATRAAAARDEANSYLPFLGTDALRQAVATRLLADTGIAYDWRTECVISAGGLSGILNALLAMIEPGDEVVISDPAYAGLLNRIRLAGGVPRLVPLRVAEGGWRLDLEALAAAASDRTKVVLTMSPSMPSGIVHSAAEWRAIADVVQRTGAWLLHDAAMERILYGAAPVLHPARLPALSGKTVTVGSVSKEYRMIGWRVGWIVGPSEIMADIGLVGLTNVVCQVGIGMPAAAAALAEDGDGDGVAAAVAEWRTRRDVVLDELSDLPVIRPDGGWSLLVDTVGLGMKPVDASRRLFEKGKVAATPMTGWGSEDHAGRYLRFVFSNEPPARLEGLRERVRAAWSL